MYTTANYVRVENDRSITRQTDAEFFFEFQRGVLLSLKEQGTLTQMQFKYAQDALQDQRRAAIQSIIQQGGEP